MSKFTRNDCGSGSKHTIRNKHMLHNRGIKVYIIGFGGKVKEYVRISLQSITRSAMPFCEARVKHADSRAAKAYFAVPGTWLDT